MNSSIRKKLIIFTIIVLVSAAIFSWNFISRENYFSGIEGQKKDQDIHFVPEGNSSPHTDACGKWNPGHYVLASYSTTQEEIEEIISNPKNRIKGIQTGYYWKDLEPQKDVYDFSLIEEHLEIAKKYDKQLFVTFFDRNWKADFQAVPDYLLDDARYKGGVEPMTNGEKRFVARIWDPLVMERSNKLIEALGKRFDREPNFEGIHFDESSLDIDKINAVGYSDRAYADALISRTDSAVKAFPNSTVILYMNWGGPELIRVIEHLNQTGIGMGGPDLVPDEGRFDYQTRIPSYDYFGKLAGKVPLGVAVQSENLVKPELFFSYCPAHPREAFCRKDKKGNYEKRKGDFTLVGFWDMGINTLKLNYIFWQNVEGERYKFQFKEDILPYINEKKGEINEACPERR